MRQRTAGASIIERFWFLRQWFPFWTARKLFVEAT